MIGVRVINKGCFAILCECKLRPTEVFGESSGEIQQNNKTTIPWATELSVIIFMTLRNITSVNRHVILL